MIRSGICISAKLAFLRGEHRIGHDYRVALLKKGADASKETTHFGPELADGEASGVGYTPGGKSLLGVAWGIDGDAAYMTFENVVWPNATISARGCIIYNNSLPGRPAIAVVNFGRTVTSEKGNFTLVIPKATATTAIIRLL